MSEVSGVAEVGTFARKHGGQSVGRVPEPASTCCLPDQRLIEVAYIADVYIYLQRTNATC